MNCDSVDRSKTSNDHRLTSIREREKQKEAQKQLIRSALQDLGVSSNPNRVTFSDSDEDDSQRKDAADHSIQVAADKLLGFDGDDDFNITLEQRFKSKNTEKLLDLQSRYGSDTRFRLDDKFAESSDSSDEDEIVATEDGMTNEAKRNMHLIDQITGHLAKSRKPRSAETFSAKSSQRYDPSNSNNVELNINKSKVSSVAKKKKKTPVLEVDTPPNHDRFYDVSADILKNTFATSHDLKPNTQQPNTFSFIQALKLDPVVDDDMLQDDDMLHEECAEESNNNCAHKDVSDDASSSDEDIPMIVTPPDNTEEEAKVFTNSTFFPVSDSDPLILGAAKSFCWNKTYHQMQKEWLEVKDILIKDYKKKHRDAKKKRADE